MDGCLVPRIQISMLMTQNLTAFLGTFKICFKNDNSYSSNEVALIYMGCIGKGYGLNFSISQEGKV